MNFRNRKAARPPLLAFTAAMAAALSLPALAQTAQSDPTSAYNQSGSGATSAGSAASNGRQTWGSVDTDGNGTISKQEAQVNAGLAQIFDQADQNANGELTPDEYKAYVAKQQGAGSGAQQR